MFDLPAAIITHYRQPDLSAAILAALAAGGIDSGKLTLADLSGFDEFHIGGAAATRELAQFAGVGRASHVLDLGCGIGGPARTLAGEFGCRVRGIDIVEEYTAAATMLTRLVGLDRLAEFRQGDMTDLPVPDCTFNLAWTQHTTMNVRDKPRLLAEIRRVLIPGGAYALYEVCAGSASPMKYPVPWASSAEISFLVSPDELRGLLRQADFELSAIEDVTSQALAVLVATRHAAPAEVGSAPRPNQRLLMGASAPEKVRNLVHNLESNRIRVVRAVARKAAT
ncbi:class I SAM-dependent methyltransferase [candidate division KSB1 bacterium]|nr:class I SAM-dependent methyltransferase [candidate division KSB1 bacterium]